MAAQKLSCLCFPSLKEGGGQSRSPVQPDHVAVIMCEEEERGLGNQQEGGKSSVTPRGRGRRGRRTSRSTGTR